MKKWSEMDGGARHNTLVAMATFGGGFARSLATAWMLADSSNSAALGEAFPGLVAKYGPGSWAYDEVARETA